jgi:hypothetical protein
MFPDGSCTQGYWNCYGEGELRATPFKASWQVASVRVLTPGTPLRADAKPSIIATVQSFRTTRR